MCAVRATSRLPRAPALSEVKGRSRREAEGVADGDARLPCALLRHNVVHTDFWVTVGQEIEVTGHAEQFRGQWQLYVLEARLVRGDPGWPRRYYRYRSARRVVAAFDVLMEALFGPPKD